MGGTRAWGASLALGVVTVLFDETRTVRTGRLIDGGRRAAIGQQ